MLYRKKFGKRIENDRQVITKKSTGDKLITCHWSNPHTPKFRYSEKAEGKIRQQSIFLFYQLLRILKVQSRKQRIELKLFLFCALKQESCQLQMLKKKSRFISSMYFLHKIVFTPIKVTQ